MSQQLQHALLPLAVAQMQYVCMTGRPASMWRRSQIACFVVLRLAPLCNTGNMLVMWTGEAEMRMLRASAKVQSHRVRSGILDSVHLAQSIKQQAWARCMAKLPSACALIAAQNL